LLFLEGGYSDDPDDRGGKTKFGITQAAWTDSGMSGDVKDVTTAQAKIWYKDTRWDDAGLGLLERAGVDERVLSEVFCGVVHCGVRRGIAMLQYG
jgi:lysozyme family protein